MFRIGPCKVLSAADVNAPVEDWTDLGDTRGDVVVTPSVALATGRSDQSGTLARADSVYRTGAVQSVTAPLLDRSIDVLRRLSPGSVKEVDTLGFGSGTAAVSPRAFALVPVEEYTPGAPWWSSEFTVWIPRGYALVGEMRHSLPEGDDADAAGAYEVEIRSLSAGASTAASVRDAGGIGRIWELGAAALGVDFLWDALGGSTAPLVGGAASFSRASTAYQRRQDQRIESVASGIARTGHYEVDPVTGLAVPTMLLEGQRTNKCQRGYNFGANGTAGWAIAGGGDPAATLTVVNDSAALAAAGLDEIVPDGMVLKLDNSGGTFSASVNGSGAAGNTNQHVASAYLRGSGLATLRIQGSAPGAVTLTPFYQRVQSAVVPATGTEVLQVRADAGAVVYIILPALEEGAFASSVIPNATTGAATRAADALSYPWLRAPEAMTAYARFFERGTALDADFGRILGVGAGGSAARFVIWRSAGGFYQANHHNGAASVFSTAATRPSLGDVVELSAQLYADGSVRLTQVTNGVEVSAAQSVPLAFTTAWSSENFRVGGSSNSTSFNAFRNVAIARGVRTLAEMRSLRRSA